MKKTIIVFILFLFSANIFSQKRGQALIDSLLASTTSQSNDTVVAKIYNRAGLYYVDVNLDSAFKYATKGMSLVQRMKWDKGISAFHTIYGQIFITKAKFDSALEEYKQSLSYSTKIKDSINIGGSYNNLGTIANAKSDYVAAARYYTKAFEISDAIKDYYNAGIACENLALVYQYQEDYTKGMSYAKKSLAAHMQIEDVEDYPAPLALIGDFFMKLTKYDSAFSYYKKALFFAKQVNDKLKEGAVLNSIAEYYATKHNYEEAVNTALEGKKIFDTVGPSFEDAVVNKGLLGYYYLQLYRKSDNKKEKNAETLLQMAHDYLEQAIQQFKSVSNKNEQAQLQKSLSEVNEMMGDYKNAYLNYKSYTEINDSVFSQANKNRLAAIESQNEIDKKNLEIEKQKLQVSEEKKNIFILLGGLLFMAAIGFLFYRVSAIRKHKNEQLTKLNKELDEANKLKAKFFGILSHDLRSPIANLVNFLNLRKIKPDALNKEQAEERENKISSSAQSLLETMESMLLWSKGQMQQFKPEHDLIKVDNLFSYIKKTFADHENISFSFKNENDLQIETDENYLRTIMYNLTNNAAKALSNIPEGKIEWKAWSENDKQFLSITDNGLGITNEKLKALYDDSADSGSKHGLGLHIIRDLAKAINCNITSASKPDEGTTFTLSITQSA
ncbi:MAG TPA: tetratricopeptide repeat-containing sensor histidine kinase [Puia sp.]|nr:tetratricopeptide repeat-containing sensor histidine kinase [Puia sp.]